MELDDVARLLDDASADVSAIGTGAVAASPAAHDFGAIAPGSIGELGRALHSQAGDAIAARSDEARALGASVAALASSLRGAAAAYRDIDSSRVASATGGGV